MVVCNFDLITDTWIKSSWDEFLQFAENQNFQDGRFYFFDDYVRVEMLPVGFRHGRYNAIISKVVSLFATLKNIKIKEVVNTSFRKKRESECQPDLAFYVGDGLKYPTLSNSPVDIDQFSAPSLVVEIAAYSVNDDLGFKRLLYERLGVKEYWVMDANKNDIIAFEIIDGGSRRIAESQVLPGLEIATVKEAVEKSQSQDDGEVNRWLLSIFG